MASLRRTLYKRLATAAPPRCTGGSRTMNGEDVDDTGLPSYSQVTGEQERPTTPPPSYYSLDEPVTRPVRTTPMFPSTQRRSQEAEQRIVDELVHRLRDIIKNPNTWRVHANGHLTFFWALRCYPGTADILYEHAQEIRDRIVGSPNLVVEKFCFVFKGQRLVDLWCRPIQEEVF
jgi:hypothetical protein